MNGIILYCFAWKGMNAYLEVINYYCYTIDEQRATAHKVVGLVLSVKPLTLLPSYMRVVFFMVLLQNSSTKREDE